MTKAEGPNDEGRKNAMVDWPFQDPEDVAVIVNIRIVRKGEWIAYASRDAVDGAWQFHTNDPGPPHMRDALLVSLREIVQLDPTIKELADLPLGWCAWRESKDSPWHRGPISGGM
jgi:hypothetical protein